MNIMENKTADIRAKDPIDILIFEKGLRIKTVLVDKELDLMVIILNNGHLVKTAISLYKRLQPASQQELEQWQLISGGTGLHWEQFDEDLSLKGFIKDSAISNVIKQLETKEMEETILV